MAIYWHATIHAEGCEHWEALGWHKRSKRGQVKRGRKAQKETQLFRNLSLFWWSTDQQTNTLRASCSNPLIAFKANTPDYDQASRLNATGNSAFFFRHHTASAENANQQLFLSSVLLPENLVQVKAIQLAKGRCTVNLLISLKGTVLLPSTEKVGFSLKTKYLLLLLQLFKQMPQESQIRKARERALFDFYPPSLTVPATQSCSTSSNYEQ